MAEIHAWFYGRNGEAEIFYDEADIPEGWQDRPSELAADNGGENQDPLPNNVMKLKALAKAENIDLGAARKGDDIKAAIVAARLAKAG